MIITGWQGALLDALAEATGERRSFEEEPAALDQAHGAHGFRATLSGGDAVFVRLAADRADLEREAAAMRLSRANGCGASEVRHLLALAGQGLPEPIFALLTDATSGILLPELIGYNLHHSEEILRGFAVTHAEIHKLSAHDSAIPTLDLGSEIGRLDPSRFPNERDWLEQHAPAAGTPVLCHGGYQPMCVSGPKRDEWAAHGGPGKGLSVANWSGALLADEEFDVAFTLVAFWSAPFFAKNRAERAAIKMIRNTLLNTYMLGYPGYQELDGDKLKYWRAFHAVRGIARLAGAYDSKGSVFEPQDRGTLPEDLGPELERYYRGLSRLR